MRRRVGDNLQTSRKLWRHGANVRRKCPDSSKHVRTRARVCLSPDPDRESAADVLPFSFFKPQFFNELCPFLFRPFSTGIGKQAARAALPPILLLPHPHEFIECLTGNLNLG